MKRLLLTFGMAVCVFMGVASYGLEAKAAGFEACLDKFDHVPARRAQANEQELCQENMAILYSNTLREPIYVAHELTVSNIDRCHTISRSGEVAEFWEDNTVARPARLAEYKNSGYDRGHLAPFCDLPYRSTNTLANIVPQNPDNNRKIWNKVEHDVRAYVQRTGKSVYVITGAYSNAVDHLNTIGHGLVVPSALWKLVSFDGVYLAYWVENSATARIETISKEELEKRLGYRL